VEILHDEGDGLPLPQSLEEPQDGLEHASFAPLRRGYARPVGQQLQSFQP
jgi:hypothetical protein